jgi:hypothetical protein
MMNRDCQELPILPYHGEPGQRLGEEKSGQLASGVSNGAALASAVVLHAPRKQFVDVAQGRIRRAFSDGRPTGDWDLLHGELVPFTDPLLDLPSIDRLAVSAWLCPSAFSLSHTWRTIALTWWQGSVTDLLGSCVQGP